MFIEDIRNDFYHQITGKRILLVVNYDLDAICASKILQTLFKLDNVLYSLVPVMGLRGLQRAFAEHKHDINHVVLINCGGCIDLVDVLQATEDVIFYICDSHRPYDICNIYSTEQVKIFGELNSTENIPAFEDIFRDSDSESSASEGGDGSDSESEGVGESRMQRIERRALKRRELRRWEQKRDELLFDYTQYSYFSRSSAMVMFELAWKLSKESMELLWWAIVGVSEQLIMGKIESVAYTLESDKIQSHVSRLTNRTGVEESAATTTKITYENDLHLVLYRHWTVLESLKHSLYPACKLKLWTSRGEKKLHELLVEMGLPLVQARQSFNSMDLVLRKEFYKMIEGLAEKYGIPDIIFGSFTLQYGYRNRFAAADYVFGLTSLLEAITQERNYEHCFLMTLEALSRNGKTFLEDGIKRAKQMLVSVFRQVQMCLELHQVRSAGPFLYYLMQEENMYFSCPYGITILAKFILRAHVAVSRNRRAIHLPLVLSSVIDPENDLCLMVGVTPVSMDSRNLFGRAFEAAADKSGVTILNDCFDQQIIQLRRTDQTKFLDALTVILS